VTPTTLYRLRDRGEIISISRGVFQLVNSECQITSPDYAAVKERVGDGVLCLISALYHHNLTTEIPRKIHLAINRNRNIPRIDYPAIKFYRMSEFHFSAGIEKMLIGGVEMNIYSAEKTIADSFKYRDKIGIDTAVEALKNYISRGGYSMSKLMEMARVCRVNNVIKPYVEAIL
jgi:predicted transcriptional regulator of viral defense system